MAEWAALSSAVPVRPSRTPPASDLCPAPLAFSTHGGRSRLAAASSSARLPASSAAGNGIPAAASSCRAGQ